MLRRLVAWWREQTIGLRIFLVIAALALAYWPLMLAWVIFAFWRNPIAH